jgi:hypothetical protein
VFVARSRRLTPVGERADARGVGIEQVTARVHELQARLGGGTAAQSSVAPQQASTSQAAAFTSQLQAQLLMQGLTAGSDAAASDPSNADDPSSDALTSSLQQMQQLQLDQASADAGGSAATATTTGGLGIQAMLAGMGQQATSAG